MRIKGWSQQMTILFLCYTAASRAFFEKNEDFFKKIVEL